MIGDRDLDGAGPLCHHGLELVPILQLIVGPGLPVATAIVWGRWRSFRRRTCGPAPSMTEAQTGGPGVAPQASKG